MELHDEHLHSVHCDDNEFIVKGIELKCAKVSIKRNSPVHCLYSVLRGKSLCFEALQREGKQSRDDQLMRIWLVALKK